jgi:hypothetical protein
VAVAGGPAGDWGKALLDAKEVPEEMQDELKAELTRGERVVWAERPRQDILMYQAKKMAIIGGSITGLISVIALVVAVVCAIKGVVLGLVLGLVFCLLPGVFCYILVTGPARTARNEARRACFALTNRRLLIHKGVGFRMVYHKTREDMADDDGRRGQNVSAWTGFELTPLRRWEHKKFEGAGSLCFTRGLYEDSPAEDVWSIDDVRGVEKMLREKLLHPIIDKLLRGEQLSQAERGKAEDERGAGEGDMMKADTNIKDYGRAQRRGGGNDPNVKAAPARAGGLNFDLARVPKDARQRVEEELTAGERIVWIGRPEAATKGRGFLGAVMNSAHREEPKYDLYALTNRRVILFFEDDKEVPISYYSPQVARAGLEDDKRIENGGNIVFKKVRKIVETVEKGTTKVLKREETHYYYGLLRIRNYQAVADLLYDTLVGPARW